MNIVMVTNTFSPHLGGVARSVEAFAAEYRARGHRVKIVAPEFPDMVHNAPDVIRVPAIRRFNGSDFSVRLPIPMRLIAILSSFEPDMMHSHHPFMLGSTALRIAHHFRIPTVFTHHTMYEQYTHYVPGDSPTMKRFVIELSTGYANLCDQVIAPSESTAGVLRSRNVTSPIAIVPTGVNTQMYAEGDGASMRESLGIPSRAFVVGHLGRLAPEKNLDFLARSVCAFMGDRPDSHFLVVGFGPSKMSIRSVFEEAAMGSRLHFAGKLDGQRLVDSYKAMNVFAFASTTETQGMVLTEAMAAGVPVVAINAPGAREVVIDGVNGRLVQTESEAAFATALSTIASLGADAKSRLTRAALSRADEFSISTCATKALDVYSRTRSKGYSPQPTKGSNWENALERLATEWRIITNAADAANAAVHPTSSRCGSGHDR
jgi:glycosyltransferase involved in cell wall biosynthesis